MRLLNPSCSAGGFPSHKREVFILIIIIYILPPLKSSSPKPLYIHIYRGLGEGAWAITYFGLPLVNADVATLDVRE